MPPVDATTRVCALIGHPIGHSLSPAIHNAAFQHLGLPYLYVAHDVDPGQLHAAIEGARVLGYRGLSVTIPHKVAALACMDEVDPTARGIGCINTVVNQAGHLVGYNSDGRGALQALVDAGAHPDGKQVLILGSGGAARAIAATLAVLAAPAGITLLGVDPPELDRLARDVRAVGRCEVRSRALDAEGLAEEVGRAELLLHCSPVGMHPEVSRSLVPPELLRPGLTVFDAVYNPRVTRLLASARDAGCRTVSGIEMFLGQAAVQFELWTGRRAPLAVMRSVLEQHL
jgi:shikimate dehydrogenase